MLVEGEIGAAELIQRAAKESLFVRTLIGLDRGAANDALAGFMAGNKVSADQIEVVNLIVDHLTNHGVMNAESLCESPFTDLTPRGPDEIFLVAQMEELLSVSENGRATAKA